MKTKSVALVAGLAMLAAAHSASATILDVTIAGHVTINTNNVDNTGVFGSIGSLSGDPFSLTLSYDPALAGPDLSLPANLGFYQTTPSFMDISITINGHTESVGTSASFDSMEVGLGGTAADSFLVENAYPAAPPGQVAGSYIDLELYSLLGTHFFSNDSVPTYIDPSLIQTGGSRVGVFQIFRYMPGNPNVTTADAFAFLGIDSVTGGSLVTPPNGTPEPASMMLLVAGLAALGVARRRRYQ
jgi:hypothetical protein